MHNSTMAWLNVTFLAIALFEKVFCSNLLVFSSVNVDKERPLDKHEEISGTSYQYPSKVGKSSMPF